MMMRILTISILMILTVLASVMLGACGETDQSLPASAKRAIDKPWQAAAGPFTAKGWTAGDKTSWESQLRTRAQTQNEFGKTQ